MNLDRYEIPRDTIWSAARMLVDQHGAKAAQVAQSVLDDRMLCEDEVRVWKSVKLAVREIIHLRQGGEVRTVH